MALGRQLAAHEIDLDSEAGWVTFALFGDEPLDFGKIADVLESANYLLHTIEFTADGTVVGEGEFELSRTGQRVAIAGDVTSGTPGRLHVRWRNAHAEGPAEVVSFEPAAPVRD